MKTAEEVQEILKGFEPVGMETIPVSEALNRVVCKEIVSEEDMPGFSRSSMDGYAVRAKDTFGVSDSLPAFLELTGEVIMGKEPEGRVLPGKTMKISTGGMIPDGADAVVMLEYCHNVDEKTIEVSRTVAPLENIIGRGDDFRKGAVILKKGTVLRPQDIGLLAGFGIEKIQVYQKPRVGIISTGDEVVPIHQKPGPGQVRDINSYTLSAFCVQAGAVPVNMGLCKDNFEEMREKAGKVLESCDTVWISGGSSVGTMDMTVKVLESFESMELLVHGIAISPGKPTIIARIGSKAVFGLPGHVASAMVVAEIFLNPFLAVLSGKVLSSGNVHQSLQAVMERNVESASGRDDYIRVKLCQKNGEFFADPVFGKSGLISTLVEADGLVKIDRNTEGLYKGQTISVLLFRPVENEE